MEKFMMKKHTEEIALGLLEDGVDIKIIIKRTGVSEAKLKLLAKQPSKKTV